jgi:hypothetical protein
VLPRPAVQFADYAHWERQLLANGLLDSELNYWRTELALPTARIRFGKRHVPSTPNFRIRSRPIELDAITLANLEAIAHQSNLTPHMVVTAALSFLLYSLTGSQDIRIAVPVANRHRSEIQNTIGHFVNTVVLCTRLSEDMTVKQLLVQVRQKLLIAYANETVPFECLVRATALAQGAKRNGFPKVLLNYQRGKSLSSTSSGLVISTFGVQDCLTESEVKPTPFDLLINFKESATGVSGFVSYKPATVTGKFLNSMIRGLPRVINDLMIQPQRRLLSGEY